MTKASPKQKQAASRHQKPSKNNRGRPSDYREEYAEQAKKLCLHGLTDEEVASFFNVHVATLYRWQIKHPEFCEALKSGKELSDERVERSLYHKAVGYTFKSEKVFQFQGAIVRANTIEHLPPDTTAAIFWLKNRRKEQWRDRSEIDQTIKGEVTVNEIRAEIEKKLGRLAKVNAELESKPIMGHA